MHRRQMLDHESLAVLGHEADVRDAVVQKSGPDDEKRLKSVTVGELPQSAQSLGDIIVSDGGLVPAHGIRLRAEVEQVQLDAGQAKEVRSLK